MNTNERRAERNSRDHIRASKSGERWPPDDILIPAFSSLVNWYTVEEISRFFGRTRFATGKKISKLGVKVFWRKNHKGIARLWQKEEKAMLYYSDAFQTQSQPEVAKKLGVTHNALKHKWSKLGSKWGQGLITLSDIARIAGCTPAAVSLRVQSMPGILKTQSHRGRGRRYRLTVEQAKKIMLEIRPGRVSHIERIFS